jgi:hypothetical protein
MNKRIKFVNKNQINQFYSMSDLKNFYLINISHKNIQNYMKLKNLKTYSSIKKMKMMLFFSPKYVEQKYEN